MHRFSVSFKSIKPRRRYMDTKRKERAGEKGKGPAK